MVPAPRRDLRRHHLVCRPTVDDKVRNLSLHRLVWLLKGCKKLAFKLPIPGRTSILADPLAINSLYG
jgi:hypothetical protein